MNNQGNLEKLARDFLSSVDEATCLFEEKFGTRCILRLWRSGKIKRYGIVKEKITYELHGAGCAVNLPHVLVNFDYGPGGRIDGFDVWRLYLYATELPKKYLRYQSQEVLELDFREYVASGRFEPMPEDRSGLYCLSKNIEGSHNDSCKKSPKKTFQARPFLSQKHNHSFSDANL